MITIKTSKGQCLDIFGLSTDTKPLDAPNASKFTEIDTGIEYLFDRENQEWHINASGGGGTDSDLVVETLTVKSESLENGITVSQTGEAVLTMAGATPQTKPVLRNVGAPVIANDAANKAYVDEAVSGASDAGAVHYTAENKTDAEKAQARANIGADPEKFLVTFTYALGAGFSADKTLAQITAAKNAGKYVEGVHEGQYFLLAELRNDAAVFQRMYDSGSGIELDMFTVDANGCTIDAVIVPEAEVTVIVDGATPTITPEDKHIYRCGELTSLTITDPPATGAWSVVFTSGATATTTTIPSTILGLEDFAAEANTLYEINVLDNRAVVGSWEVASA